MITMHVKIMFRLSITKILLSARSVSNNLILSKVLWEFKLEYSMYMEKIILLFLLNGKTKEKQSKTGYDKIDPIFISYKGV